MIEKYLNQDINNPEYLFHGSPTLLNKLTPQQSHDETGNQNNIANAIFLFPSFLKSTPYAFKDTIKEQNHQSRFVIPNGSDYPLMTMKNVTVDDDLFGYVYVFRKTEDMVKDEHEESYQYKCFHELIPCDIIKIYYKDYKEYYEIENDELKSKMVR